MIGLTEINKIGFSDKNIPAKMKGLLCSLICGSKLKYGLETLTLSNKDVERLRAFKMSIIKKALGIAVQCKSTILYYAMSLSN